MSAHNKPITVEAAKAGLSNESGWLCCLDKAVRIALMMSDLKDDNFIINSFLYSEVLANCALSSASK